MSIFSHFSQCLGANHVEKIKIFLLQKKEKFENNDQRQTDKTENILSILKAQGVVGVRAACLS
ncbi:hypothetical protein [uncultured Desulfovibrio sp.]|uniref:hypothetical protein n=1 Tax=uncultured Desulfovibrio sp. TaxID=167968 RepID=UPI0025F3EA0F|nr:hypothetical protein [uncultured Desulfovibrio sp.]